MSSSIGCDFECQRKTNLDRLRQMYNDNLDSYYSVYRLALKYQKSADAKKRQAAVGLMSEAEDLKKQMDRILDSLRKNIKQSDEILNNSDQEGDDTNDILHRKNRLISEQDEGIRNNNQELLSKRKQIRFTEERNRYRRIMIISLIIINLLLIGLFYYLINASKN